MTFADETGFDGATFSDWAQFDGATFAVSSRFGPLVCAQRVGLSGALFEAPVTLEIAAQEVACQRTQWRSTATMRLRYATVDLDDAVLAFPVAVTAHPAPFTTIFGKVPEQLLEGLDSTTMVTSVRGVDAAHLVLTDIDLSACRFFGAFHLDQIRLVGCTFARTPTGAHHLWPFEWTSRRTLVEEHHWRARTPDRKGFNPNLGWRIPPTGTEPSLIPEPEVVSGLYQQLRKALEDAKNEPDAADFYYGEMEMRRHDRENRPRSERILLTAYWMISGYGLRALRAFGSLFFAMVLTMVLLMWVGLPADPPAPRTRGTVTAEQKVDVTTKVPGPGGAAPGPLGERFTRERAEKAGRTAVNSVVFRSAGQGLTVAGTYIEMASRLVEPVLLALALLAIRGRVKR
ncbi:hypothetical protein GCM10023237_00080 [Streptomyces coeruleoprunus]|uniref:pentapeptide repeat-containing protein n=1 Tax=Streptomyces coeruleoprunus TaxID=285563 RepID=UPI0031E5209D